jgi:hypothetical protein
VKSETLVTTLTRLTTVMAVAAPIVVFGFLYILLVHPERDAAAETRHRLAIASDELNRQQLFVRPQGVVREVSALAEFDARTTEGDGVGEVADTLTALLNSPAVGGVSNLSIETGAPADAPADSTSRLFSETFKQTTVTLTFDARYEQIGRFFWNLRVLPTTFDLQSVELTPVGASGKGLMRAKASLLVFHQPDTATPVRASRTQAVDVMTSPQWGRDPFANDQRVDPQGPVAPKEPDPVVTSILFSSGRRVAMVDGRIVRAGDQVRTGIIRDIEPAAVVIVGRDGRERRVAIARPVIRMAKR